MGLFDPPEVADVCGQLGLSEDDPADREQVEMIRAFYSRPIPPREAVEAFYAAVPDCDCRDCKGHAIVGEELARANEAMYSARTRIALDYTMAIP